jgi:erythromycin esterase
MRQQRRLEDWVRAQALRLDSLEPEAALDDLEPLGEMLGGARVVAIGESAHYVPEFYRLRHRLLRFLVERCGFTIYALEAPFTEAHMIDAWVQGGPGTVAEVAAAGIAIELGRRKEMHAQLEWMRAHNRAAAWPVQFAGTDVPGSGGSPLPAFDALAIYLRDADPAALPLLEQAAGLARRYHDPATFNALHRYTALDQAQQDALTAALSRLLARMESMQSYQRRRHREEQHATALHHLRGIWHLDHLHRDVAGRGLAVGSASRDAFMAESVLRLLDRTAPDARILVASHNIHIQRTPETDGGAAGIFPQGYYLAEALGEEYVSIAVTSKHGETARIQPDPAHPRGFEVHHRPLPPLADGSIEAAFTAEAALTIADLRAARPEVQDAGSFTRIRMEDYFMEAPIFAAFDLVACLALTTSAEQG